LDYADFGRTNAYGYRGLTNAEVWRSRIKGTVREFDKTNWEENRGESS